VWLSENQPQERGKFLMRLGDEAERGSIVEMKKMTSETIQTFVPVWGKQLPN